jgi:hypothetical protein
MKLYPADRHAAPARRHGPAGAAAVQAVQSRAYERRRCACRLACRLACWPWPRVERAADRAGRLGQHQLRGAGLHAISRPARAAGGRRWISTTASRCCASWAPARTAAICRSRAHRDPLHAPPRRRHRAVRDGWLAWRLYASRAAALRSAGRLALAAGAVAIGQRPEQRRARLAAGGAVAHTAGAAALVTCWW